ncbi:MAG TPA: hypothetical protein EYG40_06105 [Verrucomicrobia bacterium]|nr:hypothetical protein [Verrucomicrobiales bacterium]HIL54593.1 hypothetical protein [Verrucomicrobiota bacterium]
MTSKISLLSLFIAFILSGCHHPYSEPTFTAPKGKENPNQWLVSQIKGQIRDLETKTGKRFKGDTIKVHDPISAKYEDWRGMPVAKIRNKFQGGLTSWKEADNVAAVYFAHADGSIPEWLIRHESLHVILLSNGILGHPKKYIKHFKKSYWWTQETADQPKHLTNRKLNELTHTSCPTCTMSLDLIRQAQMK